VRDEDVVEEPVPKKGTELTSSAFKNAKKDPLLIICPTRMLFRGELPLSTYVVRRMEEKCFTTSSIYDI
jgi:hypothetical protein